MKPLPLPVRLAAGLAVTAVEQARKLPRQLAGLPVTVVSEALQLSMRVQQQVTELAIRGDDVLAGLRQAEEEPEWATFDEDDDLADAAPTTVPTTAPTTPAEAAATTPERPERVDITPDQVNITPDRGEEDPWAAEEHALAVDEQTAPPAVLPNYDELTLPQLRARLRKLSAEDLEQLLRYERAHADRPQFTGMLARRIANLDAQKPSADHP